MSKFLKEFTGSTPFAILGAIGLLSLVSDFVGLADDVKVLVDAWKAITRPIWEYTLGYLFRWLDWPFPWWVQDYLTVGAVHTGMLLRTLRVEGIESEDYLFIIIAFFIWPLLIGPVIAGSFVSLSDNDYEPVAAYYSTLVYFLILLAINYTLLLAFQ